MSGVVLNQSTATIVGCEETGIECNAAEKYEGNGHVVSNGNGHIGNGLILGNGHVPNGVSNGYISNGHQTVDNAPSTSERAEEETHPNGDRIATREEMNNDDSNYDDINTLLFCLSPGVNRIARRGQDEAMVPYEEENAEEENAEAANAEEATCADDENSETKGDFDSLPWSRLHHLLDVTATELGDNVAYRLAIRDSRMISVEDVGNDENEASTSTIDNFRYRFEEADDDAEDDDEEMEIEGNESGLSREEGQGMVSNEVVPSGSDDNEISDSGEASDVNEVNSNSHQNNLNEEMGSSISDTCSPDSNVESRDPLHSLQNNTSENRQDDNGHRDPSCIWRNITYNMVHQRVTRIANALQVLGVGRADRIGIMLPNCPEYFGKFF